MPLLDVGSAKYPTDQYGSVYSSFIQLIHCIFTVAVFFFRDTKKPQNLFLWLHYDQYALVRPKLIYSDGDAPIKEPDPFLTESVKFARDNLDGATSFVLQFKYIPRYRECMTGRWSSVVVDYTIIRVRALSNGQVKLLRHCLPVKTNVTSIKKTYKHWSIPMHCIAVLSIRTNVQFVLAL